MLQSCSLYYVIHGTIEMLQETIDDNKSVVISKAHRNEVVGSLATLTGASFYSLRTSHSTLVAEIKKEDIYECLAEKSRIYYILFCTILCNFYPV